MSAQRRCPRMRWTLVPEAPRCRALLAPAPVTRVCCRFLFLPRYWPRFAVPLPYVWRNETKAKRILWNSCLPVRFLFGDGAWLLRACPGLPPNQLILELQYAHTLQPQTGTRAATPTADSGKSPRDPEPRGHAPVDGHQRTHTRTSGYFSRNAKNEYSHRVRIRGVVDVVVAGNGNGTPWRREPWGAASRCYWRRGKASPPPDTERSAPPDVVPDWPRVDVQRGEGEGVWSRRFAFRLFSPSGLAAWGSGFGCRAGVQGSAFPKCMI